jgi:DNA mismatch endonuclease (patch repair protein)
VPKHVSLVEKELSWASSPAVRRSMQGNRSRDTTPELLVRRYLHSVGLRYRVHFRPIKDWNRRANVVFPKAKIAVFVNGWFWHGCSKHYRLPKTNVAYWDAKIGRNIERDQETWKRLKSDGWLVIVLWEHEDLQTKVRSTAKQIKKRLD